MKSLEQLQKENTPKIVFPSNPQAFSRVNSLYQKDIDMVVYLESKRCNLQRGLVWPQEMKEELIMSILIGRSIPPLTILNTFDKDTYEIIDGKQRLSTIIGFYDNDFTVKIEDCDYYYKDLPEDYKRQISGHFIMAYVANESHSKKYTDDDKLELFHFLNYQRVNH